MSIPLHPIAVHFPLVLSIASPLVIIAFMIRKRNGRPGVSWWPIVAYHAVLFTSALIAMQLGEGDEERVESVVAESLIEHHEFWGNTLTWTAGILLLVVLVAWRWNPKRLTVSLALIGAFGCAGVAAAAGHSGGELVYVHGAGQAYSQGASALSGSQSGNPVRHDDDD